MIGDEDNTSLATGPLIPNLGSMVKAMESLGRCIYFASYAEASELDLEYDLERSLGTFARNIKSLPVTMVLNIGELRKNIFSKFYVIRDGDYEGYDENANYNIGIKIHVGLRKGRRHVKETRTIAALLRSDEGFEVPLDSITSDILVLYCTTLEANSAKDLVMMADQENSQLAQRAVIIETPNEPFYDGSIYLRNGANIRRAGKYVDLGEGIDRVAVYQIPLTRRMGPE